MLGVLSINTVNRILLVVQPSRESSFPPDTTDTNAVMKDITQSSHVSDFAMNHIREKNKTHFAEIKAKRATIFAGRSPIH